MSLSFRVNPEYAQISEIVPGLFICGVSALTRDEMKKHKITHIINATTEVPNLRSLGDIQRTKLWLEDTPQTYIYPHLELQSDQVVIDIYIYLLDHIYHLRLLPVADAICSLLFSASNFLFPKFTKLVILTYTLQNNCAVRLMRVFLRDDIIV
uniref:DSPc domain-containing protein n=1 Tax=Heterorhabditis bacteriophora TaxID=37862 RepID=A0A1I7W8T8_HETBA